MFLINLILKLFQTKKKNAHFVIQVSSFNTMLIPCGHFLCKICVFKNSLNFKNQNKCLVCFKNIESVSDF